MLTLNNAAGDSELERNITLANHGAGTVLYHHRNDGGRGHTCQKHRPRCSMRCGQARRGEQIECAHARMAGTSGRNCRRLSGCVGAAEIQMTINAASGEMPNFGFSLSLNKVLFIPGYTRLDTLSS